MPVGFVSDHVEVQWDLDVEAAAVAAELGLGFTRTPTPGTDPRFVAMVRELVEERLDPQLPEAGAVAARSVARHLPGRLLPARRPLATG